MITDTSNINLLRFILIVYISLNRIVHGNVSIMPKVTMTSVHPKKNLEANLNKKLFLSFQQQIYLFCLILHVNK